MLLFSLTPGSYNMVSARGQRNAVVVPILTPGSYNESLTLSITWCVVVPSLTPGSYNTEVRANEAVTVVVPLSPRVAIIAKLKRLYA